MAALEIYQLEGGYCYNTDSLILAHFAKDLLKKNARVLDIGAGCGVVGALLGREAGEKNQNIELDLIEKDELTSALAWRNTRPFCARVYCADFTQFTPPHKYDLLVSNPPFYTQGALLGQNERKNMARHAHFLPLSILLKQAKRALKPNGIFCFCYEARSTPLVLHSLLDSGFSAQALRFVYPLSDRESSLLLVRAKISRNQTTRILPALFTHQSPSQMDNTKELRELYEWAQTQSIKVSEEAALKMLREKQEAENLL